MTVENVRSKLGVGAEKVIAILWKYFGKSSICGRTECVDFIAFTKTKKQKKTQVRNLHIVIKYIYTSNGSIMKYFGEAYLILFLAFQSAVFPVFVESPFQTWSGI